MRIHPLDLAIVIAYLLAVTALGMRFRRSKKDVAQSDRESVSLDYFLGGRTAPWWALPLSIVATEASALTIIGTPAIAYSTNLTFIQLVIGYLIGRVMIVLLLLPGYLRAQFLPISPRRRTKTTRLRFLLRPSRQIPFLVRPNRRRLPNHGHPRHGPNHRPKT